MSEALERGLAELGLDPSLASPLLAYLRLLLEKNRVMDLTAVTGEEEAVRLHLLDSLCLLPDLRGKSCVDVGSGAGLPGIPLAVARPDMDFTLLDSSGKRVGFLEEARSALGLANVTCVQARAEEFAAARRESFDLAVSRAVAAMPALCELCLPLVRPGGTFLAMKSRSSGAEVAGAERAIAVLGGRLRGQRDYAVPRTEIVHRTVAVDKVSPTPEKYPRRFAQIRRSPL